MFKRTANVLRPHLRNLHTQAAGATRAARGNAVALTVASGAAAGAALWYNTETVHNDAIQIMPHVQPATAKAAGSSAETDPDVLHSMIWGSNEAKLLSPESPDKVSHRVPTIAHWLDNVALRDLKLGKKTGACIDARGDVYQWGEGFFGEILENVSRPKSTLRGKNIVQLQLTDEKLYALSASGKIYVLATDAFAQALPTGAPTPASDSWWGTGWLWGEDENIDFAEVTPAESLGWRESFTSIAAGKNHLLALTSSGRVFAHPVNKKANQWGQLGFRKFSIPDPASSLTNSKAHIHVELIPKSFTDPFAKETRDAVIDGTVVSGDLSKIDDSSIRFCPNLFEIPVLKGVNVAQIAAGARTSFARTKEGRVLGWGANEYGQIGLGGSVVVDSITVPTEVVLWRLTERGTKTKCLDVTAGGDLTAFVVERNKEHRPTTTDLLMCGNGQYGGLGNNTYSSGQSAPSRVRGISGLLQYSDKLHGLTPVTPEEISISPDGHVIMALNSSEDSHGVGGRDVMVWGKNYGHELGNGKKASSAVPINLEGPDGSRLMLMSRKAKQVKDLQGQVWKKGVKVEQRALAGDGSSVVYWKIVD
ncbi:hypothetical protein CVT24_010407 [Panaeolus cyanescens]|uniref:Uncharacterized protein n=1 Tax=Panaeolus cyanescens TaxID=181874 RepID=A0A409YPM7_9AGAR|nr:hypothetical protein CVT24_010407 [Panaeolus cyanescens]